MPQFIIFRQELADGGRRDGVEYAGRIYLEQFVPGTEEYDPILKWYIDVRCEGKIPFLRTLEEIRRWALDRKDEVVPALHSLADELTAGIDNRRPLKRKVPSSRKGWKTVLLVAAQRRIDALEIAEKLRDTADHWDELLQNLPDARLAYTWPE